MTNVNSTYTWTPYIPLQVTKLNVEKFYTLKLQRAELPQAVYISGKRLSVGILGSRVECQYVGGSKLFFEEHTIKSLPGDHIIIEYSDEIHTYIREDSPGSSYSYDIDVSLVNIIKK